MDLTELKLAGPSVRHEVDYDANGNVIYEGYAPPGTLVSNPPWFILNHIYDVSNKYLRTLSIRNAIYANRAGLTYT